MVTCTDGGLGTQDAHEVYQNGLHVYTLLFSPMRYCRMCTYAVEVFKIIHVCRRIAFSCLVRNILAEQQDGT